MLPGLVVDSINIIRRDDEMDNVTAASASSSFEAFSFTYNNCTAPQPPTEKSIIGFNVSTNIVLAEFPDLPPQEEGSSYVIARNP